MVGPIRAFGRLPQLLIAAALTLCTCYAQETEASEDPKPSQPRKAVVDPASIHELHQVPSSYRYSGEYVLHRRTKASALEQIHTPTSALRYHVFTDGEEVRIYLATVPQEFSVFQIYRSDGVQILKDEGQTQELVPGVQATTMTGGKLRHLCLARDFFQLTEFPGNSDQVIILRAQRVGAKLPKKSQ